jgi:hypothetical protein
MPTEKKACIVDIKKNSGHVNIHIFVLKYLVQITNNSKSIQNFRKEVNGTATKCRVYTVHEWLNRPKHKIGSTLTFHKQNSAKSTS